MKLINKYKSPNFNKRKKGSFIKYIILHYTAMETDVDAIKYLLDKKNKVSSHYLINKKGIIFNLVNSNSRAWHAGKSFWLGETDINSNSIGIELDNSGHHLNFEIFCKKQMDALVDLIIFLKNKYKIESHNILGHSDIAPYRKKDPGEKFPWKKLANLDLITFPRKQLKIFNKINDYLEKKQIFSNRSKALFMLSRIGYDVQPSLIEKNKFQLLLNVYQMHYRQKKINGILDDETLKIITNHFNDVLTI